MLGTSEVLQLPIYVFLQEPQQDDGDSDDSGDPFDLNEMVSDFITCSAMILDAYWSIGVRSGAVHPLQFQYHTAEFNTTTWRTNLIDITTLTA